MLVRLLVELLQLALNLLILLRRVGRQRSTTLERLALSARLLHLVRVGPALRLLVVVEGLEQLLHLRGARRHAVLREVLRVLGGSHCAA